jgi:nitrate/nitrite transporter NarK
LIAAPFLGITAFLYTPLMATGVTQQAGVGLAGSATGLTSALWQLGSTIVPMAVGIIFQATHSFNVAFVVLAVGPALAAVSMLFVQEGQAVRKLSMP